jgi:hypothetical protein
VGSQRLTASAMARQDYYAYYKNNVINLYTSGRQRIY